MALGVFMSEYCQGKEPMVAFFAGGYPPYKLDFLSDYGSYHYRMSGQYEGDGHIKPVDVTIDRLWRQASNAVQWKPPGDAAPIVAPAWARGSRAGSARSMR
jgi:hypothetical protein